ncbi:hypothetical protein QTO34_004104 [Cnephaeus nilssonii]|uniref:Uncharacterized protein n=1 Tax=Cnephaeus nilssonii TaxID=3371016 RepID=A0AA40LLZ6_CNENI|nr:hypothetical protein QTO34_004104 [Eptesicus nilssonii]
MSPAVSEQTAGACLPLAVAVRGKQSPTGLPQRADSRDLLAPGPEDSRASAPGGQCQTMPEHYPTTSTSDTLKFRRSKVQVAKESVLQYYRKANITAHHDSNMKPNYDVEYF